MPEDEPTADWTNYEPPTGLESDVKEVIDD